MEIIIEHAGSYDGRDLVNDGWRIVLFPRTYTFGDTPAYPVYFAIKGEQVHTLTYSHIMRRPIYIMEAASPNSLLAGRINADAEALKAFWQHAR